MIRYCTNCQKEFDFQIKSMADLDTLICPCCGASVGRNSRKPVDIAGTEKTETAIGNAYYKILRFFYLFYVICAIAGYTAYSFHLDTFLYISTIIPLVVFTIQLITGTATFRTGIFLLPIGAMLGIFIFHTIQGSCLGIHTVFLLRHLIRDIFFKFINWLINLK